MGLRIAWDHELRKVELQVDSTTIINLIEADNEPRHQHAMEVLDLRELLHHEWEVRLMHVYKEGNHAADFLAGIGFIHPIGCHMVSTSNVSLGCFLRYDCFGITETHSIIIND
ncbi:Putative ribonuclease H protein At1g65750 [Linum perenne]